MNANSVSREVSQSASSGLLDAIDKEPETRMSSAAEDDYSNDSTALLSESVEKNDFMHVNLNRLESLLQQLIDYPITDRERVHCKDLLTDCRIKFEQLSKKLLVRTPPKAAPKTTPRKSFDSVRFIWEMFNLTLA